MFLVVAPGLQKVASRPPVLPFTIGKELAGWVEKLFEVTISPETLKTRARRIAEKNGSNEPKKSKAIDSV